jgi:predicted TIM-barrel fold metal-dependent hydrolase
VAGQGRFDIHYHVVMPGSELAGLRGGPSAWSPQRAIEELDRNGVATGFVSSASGWRRDNPEQARMAARQWNDYVKRLGQDHPGRFGLLAALPLPDIDASLEEVEYAFDTLGADGIGLQTSYDALWLGDAVFTPLWQELERRHAVVYVHPTDAPCSVGLSYMGAPVFGSWIEWPMNSARTMFSLLLNQVPRRFPHVRFVFAHDGGTMPLLVGRIQGMAQNSRPEFPAKVQEIFPEGVAAEYRKFYFDTAQGFAAVNFAAMRALVPESHILFGSDYPFFPISASVEGLAKLNLPAELLQAIERGNTEALLASARRR